MFNLNCYIEISVAGLNKRLEFTSVNAVEIESSWRKFTDTCKITLPRKLRVLNGNINDVIKRGSKVKVWLGYDGNLQLEFVGYVARVDAKVPFVVECEDEMWVYKQNKVSKTYRSTSLKELIKDIYPGEANVVDFQLGAYRIDRASTAVVLDDLQKNYNVFSYFSYSSPDGEPTLNVSLGGYDFKNLSKKHSYNMMANVVENNLTYRRADENRVRIVTTTTNKGGVVLTTEKGDPDGEEVKLDKRGLKKEELDSLAMSELQKRKFDGYKGNITGFGLPFCKHNEIAVVQDAEYAERAGAYMIDMVKPSFGVGGFRRQIDLGIKV